MAFFTRTKSVIPIPPDEEGDLSGEEWEGELEERRTPDGRSSKTSYELRREANQTETSEQVVECKNPCLNPEPHFENPAENHQEEKEKEEVRYDFVVDRVLGVQV